MDLSYRRDVFTSFGTKEPLTMFKNNILLVTGGTGSFGSHITKILLRSDIGQIRIFSRDEKKQDDMRNELKDDRVKFYIGDIRDYESLNQALKGVNYVFHAAALKQVPSCEFYPLEAIKTNVIGADNVMSASVSQKIKKVILLSTDKAVYPINAMGQTKALMEKIMVSRARLQGDNETVLCATRYGNVMASRGSVIPLFISQILDKKEISITDPSMTRFLMSLDQSVDLVMHAFQNGLQGDIYIQKAPACTIETLVNALKEIFEANNPIRIIGTRHGEKLYESLVSREEMVRAENQGAYYRIPADNRELNYEKYFSSGEDNISYTEDYTSHNTKQLNVNEVKNLLLGLDFVKIQLARLQSS
jgi:UDP-N-acetylglucosamine 4,6-dehydratase